MKRLSQFKQWEKCQKLIYITKFNLKIINGGSRLLVENVDDFMKVKHLLALDQTEFYTFDLQNEKQFKACLYGLPNFTTDEVKGFLTEKGLEPIEVKQINIKNRASTMMLYSLYTSNTAQPT
jgi:hypothetical protein